MTLEVLRYAAFSDGGRGGNPAGVVLDADDLSEREMLAVAGAIGYSETAFVLRGRTSGELRVRYFSPRAEVAFCGHATIATAVALAERDRPTLLLLDTAAGPVSVRTTRRGDDVRAALVSPPASVRPVAPTALARALEAFGWHAAELDGTLPPAIAHAGNDHLVLGVRDAATLARFDYDYPALDELMAEQGWTTVHAFRRVGPALFDARDAFPPGGVREDPATGAAAAAFGGYLRDLGALTTSGRFTVLQGRAMGAPSRLDVHAPADTWSVVVEGAARPVPASPIDDVVGL